MSYYKIKNITDKLGKRDVNKDMILNIEYHVGFQKKYHKLKPNDIVVLSCRNLPMSVHTLHSKKLIIIQEISENDFYRLQKPGARKNVINNEKNSVANNVERKIMKKATRKTTRKKK